MTVNYDIECDGCASIADGSTTSAGTARARLAADLGWHVNLKGGRDLCAECWAKGVR